MSTHKQPSERLVVFLLGAVQFINILDFVMVMPLGPDFAAALGVPLHRLGQVGGSYALAASASGLLGAFFLERFDRRKALGVAMLGLVGGTVAGGFAAGFQTLIAARVWAGAFGGPATALSLAILADLIPPERRGRALGAVFGAFSIASIAGVPAALWLAQHGGWRLPFLAVGGMGLVICAMAIFFLPPVRAHLGSLGPPSLARFAALLGKTQVRLSYLMTALVMSAGFLVIPNLAAFVLVRMGARREALDELYLIGGAVSFVSMRAVGRLVDRYGSARVGSVGAAMLIAVFLLGLGLKPPALTPLAFFVGLMMAMAVRNVSYNTLTSKVPLPHERAAFMSLQSSVGHLFSAAGAFGSALLLETNQEGTLSGVGRVVGLSIALTALLPLLLWQVERRVLGAAAHPS